MEQIIGTDDIVDHAIVDAVVRAGKAVARIVAPGIADFSRVGARAAQRCLGPGKENSPALRWLRHRLDPGQRAARPDHEQPCAAASRGGRGSHGGIRFRAQPARWRTSAKFIARLRPGELFITDPNMLFGGLDYTVVALSRPVPEEFGFLEPMQGITAARTTNIFIVQHPNGAGKAYALNNSRKVSLLERYVTYVSDTLEGSSGSALFDDRVRLVGIHHLGNYVETIGGVEQQVNLGSRIEFVIEDIATKLRAVPEWDEPKVREYFGDGMVLQAWRRLG